jgi:predicted kinase
MTLIAMAGLPGAGKSTVADGLAFAVNAVVVSVDPIESAMWTAGIPGDQPTGLAAYVVADVIARANLAVGHTVVIDAVNAVEPARAMWRTTARRLDVPLRFIEVICSDERVHRNRLAARRRDIAGHEETSWDLVVQARQAWEPWADDQLTLDSLDDDTRNLRRALDYVSSSASASGG